MINAEWFFILYTLYSQLIMIDTHSHIYDSDFDSDRIEVVNRALDAGVEKVLLANVDTSTIAPMS